MSNDDHRFASTLRDLGDDEFGAFVAALWQSRGHSVTDSDDGPLRVDDGDRRLFTWTGDGDPPAGLGEEDRLVVAGIAVTGNGDPASAEVVIPERIPVEHVVDAAELRQRVLYAVDGDARTTLAATFFDGDQDVFGGYVGDPPPADWTGPGVDRSILAGGGGSPGPSPSSGRDDSDNSRSEDPRQGGRSPSDGRSGTRARMRADGPNRGGSDGHERTGGDSRSPDGDPDPLLAPRPVVLGAAVLVVASIVVVGLAMGGIGPLAAPSTPDDAENDSRSSLPPDYEFANVGRTTVPPSVQQGVQLEWNESEELPPGVSADGTIDEDVLGDAHVAAIENRSYRVTITHRERIDGTYAVRWEERATVRSDGNFTAETVRIGDPVDSTLLVDQNPGVNSERYRDPPANGPVATAAGEDDPYPERFRNAIDWFLSVDESSIDDQFTVDGTTMFWITYRGDPWPGVENTTGAALVDQHGVVHEIHREYTVPNQPNVTATVVVRLEFLDGGVGSVPGRTTGSTTTAGNESAVDESRTTTGG